MDNSKMLPSESDNDIHCIKYSPKDIALLIKRIINMCKGIKENVSEDIQLKIKERQSSNLEILSFIRNIVEKYPELRFCQILAILKLDEDRIYEESSDTLKSIIKEWGDI